ncbi:tyrosine-type recombinase/integrase [Candidatus Methylospira mobilis]|uniref:Tyrosine-type recombinase/integrase n=1 Tax=Candidatus Methylospira mobilis TaxID=1808979 RepID=A0A5Q0BGT7_9GAMM|nr:tyrosine-type recombinase/integrase [Candidatus Methylospira mobilis]
MPLSSVAASAVNSQRGRSAEWVFTCDGNRITRLTNTAWKSGRKRAGLPDVRIHDLRHTFARRLRSVDVSQEDIAELLGHRYGTVTQHYSKAAIERLFSCLDKLADDDGNSAEMVLLRKAG